MEKKALIWLLYQKQWKDYLKERKLQESIRQIFNPIPTIISIDVAMILKGLKITGADEIIQANDIDWVLKEVVRCMLIDGIAWLDISLVNGKIYLAPLSINEVSDLKYDEGGNIIQATVKTELMTKQYIIDEQGKRWVKITTPEQEGEPVPYTREFIPLVEFTGLYTDDEKNISRVEGIEDTIDAINEYEHIIMRIARLHGDPVIWGNVSMDTNEVTEKDKKRQEGEFRYLEVPEGGNLQYLEMSGNVMRYAMEKVQQLKEDVIYEYPELMLNQIMRGGAMTGYAVTLKLTGLDTVISGYRANFEAGLKKTLTYALIMLGKKPEFTVEFEPILPPDKDAVLSRVLQAYSGGLLPFETAVRKIAHLFGEDPQDVLQKLQEAQDVYAQQWEVVSNEEG